MGDKGFFDTFMDQAENVMDKVEGVATPVLVDEGTGDQYVWKSARGNDDEYWVFHAFQGNAPICRKELSIIGDATLRGGHVNACCKCLRMTTELVKGDEE